MDLGNFSVSLAVKDLAASRTFYETLGFAVVGGEAEAGWLILKNAGCTVGLFQGMFEKNTLTFNPGLDADGRPAVGYTDVRDIQKALKAQGVTIAAEADETSTGPAHCLVIDPDGNPILIDQHV